MRSSLAVSLLVCALLGGSAEAATKRAVKPVETIPFTYNLYDSVTGHPVVGAEVRSGTQLAITDAQGGFTIAVLGGGRWTMVTVHRTGYDDLTFNVSFPVAPSVPISTPLPPNAVITYPVNPSTPAPTPVPAPAPTPTPVPAPPPAGIPLTPHAPVSVQLTSGQTVHLDADSVQFAYVLPFETPQGSNAASFCRSDGTAWTPDRSEISQITGPATTITNSACCKLGPLLGVDVKLKSGGQTLKVTFADSCFGYDIDFVGRDHESAQYLYFNFKDVALITFP
jgi:hypothetical protein